MPRKVVTESTPKINGATHLFGYVNGNSANQEAKACQAVVSHSVNIATCASTNRTKAGRNTSRRLPDFQSLMTSVMTITSMSAVESVFRRFIPGKDTGCPLYLVFNSPLPARQGNCHEVRRRPLGNPRPANHAHFSQHRSTNCLYHLVAHRQNTFAW